MATSDDATRGLKRPRYFDRQQLQAEDLSLEQDYIDRRLQRQNRYLHGCGVVCGLEVRPAAAAEGQALRVVVTPGFALSPTGEEIFVGSEQTVCACLPVQTSGDCADLSPAGEEGEQRSYIAIRSAGQPCMPMPAIPESCGPSARWEYARTCETFEIRCFDQPPDACLPRDIGCSRLPELIYGPGQAQSGTNTCPPDSDSPWVILAALNLTAEGSLEVDYSVRAQIVSGRFLDEIFRCGPAGVAAISPAQGGQGETLQAVISGWGLDRIRYLTFSGTGVRAERIVEQIRLMTHDGAVNKAVYSPDGAHLASIGNDLTARAWNAATGQEVGRLSLGGLPLDLGWSPDGSLVAVAQGNGIVTIWSFPAGQAVRAINHGAAITSIAHSPQGPYLATVGTNFMARIWDVSGGRELSRLTPGTGIRAVAFAPEGRYLWARCDDNSVRQWDILTGREITAFPHADFLYAWDLSADGRWLATADSAGAVRIFDTRSRAQAVAFSYIGSAILDLSFSPDGERLAVGGYDGTVRIHAVKDGHLHAGFDTDGPLMDAVFSPDGRTLATKSFFHSSVAVWDHASGRRIATVSHANFVESMSFSPDSGVLTTTGRDNGIRCWNLLPGSGCRLPVRIGIGQSARAGLRSFQLHGPEGMIDSTAAGVSFAVMQAAPTIASVSPDNRLPGAVVDVAIQGRHLSGASGVVFQGGGIAATILSGSDTSVAVRLAISPYASPGSRTFQVTTPRGVVDSQDFGVSFRVRSPYGYLDNDAGFGMIGGDLL